MSDDPSMSDYRNQDFTHLSLEDPFASSAKMDPHTRAANMAGGWIAASVFLVIVLAVAFGIGHQPGGIGTNTASNDVAQPAATHMTPPPASILPPPIMPAPNMPAPYSGTQ
jgi:hypothetical protein